MTVPNYFLRFPLKTYIPLSHLTDHACTTRAEQSVSSKKNKNLTEMRTLNF
jgi:hypothetical protein